MATQHPLQKMASPSRGFSLLLHVAGFTSFVASFIYIHQAPLPMDLSKAYGGHFQFLTVLGLGVSTVAFALGIVADITLSPIIFAFKNALAFIATPANVLVAVMYWSIYAYDRRLLMPTDFRLPIIPDMSLHAIPSILLGLDFLLFSPPWKTTTASSLGLAAVLTLIYWAWVERCYSYNGWYPYPMFHMLEPPQRALVFIFGALLMTGNAVVLKWLYNRLNPPKHRKVAIKTK